MDISNNIPKLLLLYIGFVAAYNT